ncbi:D-alanine--D-alanine ligase [Candidatus Latescibacterota bacterium]
MKIAVFMGGSSDEREVSLMSGNAIYSGLKEKYQDVTLFDVEWSGKDTLFSAVTESLESGTDIIFSALHGGLGENGGIQGILEAAGLTYTGSGITASAIAMNKEITKSLFSRYGIPTAPWLSGIPDKLDTSRIETEIGFPHVIKPVDQGSSIGLSVVNEPNEIPAAIEYAARYGELLMAEKYIAGKELSVPILGDDALPVIEIIPSHKMYDYECKYKPGLTEYVVPANIPDSLTFEIQSLARKAFDILGLRDIARIDFRLDENDTPLCFEANTLPGMTATSLVPKSAAKAGIDFPELVSRIAELAFKRKGKKRIWH